MATLGQTLKAAREAKGLTASEAAAATRIKIQHIEAIEQDDFTKIPAPAYAKGFIKLYSEYLGMDPQPFVDAYLKFYAPKDRSPIYDGDNPAEKHHDTGRPKKFNWVNFYRIPSAISKTLSKAQRGVLAGGFGVAVLAIIFVVSFKQCGGEAQFTEAQGTEQIEIGNRPVQALIKEPPEPYLDLSNTP